MQNLAVLSVFLISANLDSSLNDCITRTVLHFSRELGLATLEYMSPIRSGPNLAMPAFEACLATVEGNRSRGTSYVNTEVSRCVEASFKPNLIREVRVYFNGRIPSNLNATQRSVVEEAFTLLSPAFDGKIISSGSGASDPVASLRSSFTQLSSFVSDAARFDSATTRSRIQAFKTRIDSRIQGDNTITDTQFMESLVQSDLMTTIVQSTIASRVIAKANEYGLGGQARDRIVTPENMRAIFESSQRAD